MSYSDTGSKTAPGKPSVRSRMTSLVRRSSTALSFTRPAASSRRSSSESLVVDTHQSLAPPEVAIGHKLPSPVPESPAVGPTPIASPTPVQASYRPPSAPIDIPVKTPPPHNNWGDGPITITPSSIASPEVTARSEGAPTSLAAEDGRSFNQEQLARAEDEISMEGVSAGAGPRISQTGPDSPHTASLPDEEGDVTERWTKTQTGQEPLAAVHAPESAGSPPGNEASEHQFPMNTDQVHLTDAAPNRGDPAEISAIDLAHVGIYADAMSAPAETRSTQDVPSALISDPAPSGDQLVYDGGAMETRRSTSVTDDIESGRSRGSTVSSQAHPLTPPAAYTRTSTSAKTSIAPSAENAAPVVIIDYPHDTTSTPSSPMYNDPFADPMPEPETTTRVYSPDRAAFQSPMDPLPSDHQSVYSIPLPAPVPLPVTSTPVHVQRGPQWNDPAGHIYNERLSLIRGPLQTPSESINFPEPVPGYGTVPSIDLGFESLGWLMHILPDTTVYFTHPGLRIVTDVDLRSESTTRDVSRYLGSSRVRPPSGWELWLRNTGNVSARTPEHSFVHHEKRVVVPVSYEPEPINPSAEELLTLQASYWRYVEKHPAHVVLSPATSTEATDILTWAYTDRLLPPEARERIPPFSQDECHELSAILRSLDVNPSPNHIAIRTRVVAKIMLRICRWKQGQVSMNEYESLARSASNVQPSFIRRAADVAMSLACLGVPYLFVDRPRSRREYYEGGMRSTAGSMLVLGAVACMIAAVILGASVALISIPGLNDISRIASFISIILSASSLVSALLALFRWKTDIERNAYPGLGQEGFMVTTRRSVLLSLPLVFLIWAIAAFVIGVALHMLRGLVLPRHIEKYMQWVVVGSVGGLAGMLFACGLLLL